MTVRLRSGSTAPRKADGSVMTLNETKQFMAGALDDPETTALLEKITFPGKMQAMVIEVAEIVEGMPEIPDPVAFAKKWVPFMEVFHPQAMAGLAELEAKARIEHTQALARVTQASAEKVVTLTHAQSETRRKEIDDAFNAALDATTAGIESFGGLKVDKDGVVLPGSTFLGIPTGPARKTTKAAQSPFRLRHWTMLFHPLLPDAQTGFREMGLEPPDGVTALTEENIEEVLTTMEKVLGHTIETLSIPDAAKPDGTRKVSRENLKALAFYTRNAIIPRYRELLGAATTEASQAFEAEDALRQAAKVVGTALGGPAGTDAVDPLTGAPTNPADDEFQRLMGDFVQRNNDLRNESLNRLQELNKQLKRAPMTPEEIEEDVDQDIEELDRREREE
jgi:hypothetical protein